MRKMISSGDRECFDGLEQYKTSRDTQHKFDVGLNDSATAGNVARAEAKYVPARVCGSLSHMNRDTAENPQANC
jgi:hypothetical protein